MSNRPKLTLEMLIRAGNSVTSEFLSVLVGVGVLASGWGDYVMVMCCNLFPFIIHLWCSVVYFVGLTVKFLLIYLPVPPYPNGESFRSIFICLIGFREKFGRLKLRGSSSIAYEVGSDARNAQFSTTLSISSAIGNLAATLMLMELQTFNDNLDMLK